MAFANTAISQDEIEVAASALHATVNNLPQPVSSTEVNILATFILRTVRAGERDVTVLRTTATMELQPAVRRQPFR